MATITLYKDRLNGVGGLIDNIIKSSNNLDTQLGTLKSTLQGVSSSAYNLQDTVNSISSSSKTEKEKVSDLKKLNKKVTEFITTTVNRDNSARDEINKSKKNFYSKYSYLKPECEKDTIEKIVDGVEKAADWCAEHWKIIVTAVIVVVAVVLLCTGIGTGLGAAILAGACWGAIFGAVIGGVSGGINSLKNGGSFLEGFENGSFDGAIGGMIGGAITGGAAFAIGPGMSLASSIIRNSGIGALSSGSSNMVVTTIDYLIEHRNLNGAMDDILLSGVSGAFSGAFLGGITGALTYVKSGIKNSWYNSDGSINYPPNNGAIKGTEKNINLKPGKTIGRCGNIGDKSNFVTKTGTNPNRLALPPNTSPSIYQEFEVVKEIPNTIQAKIAAWGGSPGGGIQYELPMPIKQLIREGYIIPK